MRAGIGEVGVDLGEIRVGLGGEYRIESLLELIQRQPSCRVMLAQAGCGRFAVRVADPDARSCRHLSSRWVRSSALMLSAIRYIATSLPATANQNLRHIALCGGGVSG
jgi:hypothetical protein